MLCRVRGIPTTLREQDCECETWNCDSLKTTRRTSKMTIPRLDKGFFIEIYSIFFNSFWNDFEKKNVCICMKSWMWEYRLHEFSEVAEVSSVEDSPVYSKNSGKNQIFYHWVLL